MASPGRAPQQGEIWLADLVPPVGHELAGPPRPVLVISGARMNQAPYAVSVIVPLSTRLREVPGHILLPAATSGLRADSAIMCEHVRSVSHRRFRSTGPLARVSSEVVGAVVRQVSELLES